MTASKLSISVLAKWPLRCLLGLCTLMTSCTDRRGSVAGTQSDLHAQPATNAPAQFKPRPARDWSAHPPIAQIQSNSEIDVVGDIHGDYERLVELLVAGRLIDQMPDTPAEVRWRGGGKILLSVGDLINQTDPGMEV